MSFALVRHFRPLLTAGAQCAGVLAAVALLARYDASRIQAASSVALRSTALMALAFFLLGRCPSVRHLTLHVLARVGHLFVAGALTIVASAWLGVQLPVIMIMTMSYAAFAEEVVFRQGLPASLTHALRPMGQRTHVAAVVILSQLTFALSHFVGASPILQVRRLVVLLAAGVALYLIVIVFGLSLAGAAHALVNILSLVASHGLVMHWLLFALGGVGLLRLIVSRERTYAAAPLIHLP